MKYHEIATINCKHDKRFEVIESLYQIYKISNPKSSQNQSKINKYDIEINEKNTYVKTAFEFFRK